MIEHGNASKSVLFMIAIATIRMFTPYIYIGHLRSTSEVLLMEGSIVEP